MGLGYPGWCWVLWYGTGGVWCTRYCTNAVLVYLTLPCVALVVIPTVLVHNLNLLYWRWYCWLWYLMVPYCVWLSLGRGVERGWGLGVSTVYGDGYTCGKCLRRAVNGRVCVCVSVHVWREPVHPWQRGGEAGEAPRPTCVGTRAVAYCCCPPSCTKICSSKNGVCTHTHMGQSQHLTVHNKSTTHTGLDGWCCRARRQPKTWSTISRWASTCLQPRQTCMRSHPSHTIPHTW